MKSLTKNEWVAVAVSLAVIAGFFYFLPLIIQHLPMNAQNSSASVKVAEKGSMVTVDYTGRLENGQVFDSSANHGPIKFTLGAGQVIPGWDEGLLGMKVGEKRHLVIPPEKAYGAQGYPPVIPPNATLIFDVQLVDTQSSAQ